MEQPAMCKKKIQNPLHPNMYRIRSNFSFALFNFIVKITKWWKKLSNIYESIYDDKGCRVIVWSQIKCLINLLEKNIKLFSHDPD